MKRYTRRVNLMATILYAVNQFYSVFLFLFVIQLIEYSFAVRGSVVFEVKFQIFLTIHT